LISVDLDDAESVGDEALGGVYPIVFLDCLVLKIREGGSGPATPAY